jgi:antitoxin (DNA-binding transcriptional repressor) of toxin-antitoxin stability system
MDSNTEVVNAFEAKTRLSELLRETEKGVSFRILRRGKEVAWLIPPLKEDRKRGLKQVLTSFKEVRGRVPGKIKIRELIEEGRRF